MQEAMYTYTVLSSPSENSQISYSTALVSFLSGRVVSEVLQGGLWIDSWLHHLLRELFTTLGLSVSICTMRIPVLTTALGIHRWLGR